MAFDLDHPYESSEPVGPLAEIVEKGLNPLRAQSCAVPDPHRIKGCQYAERCCLRYFGRPEFEGFGPKINRPGESGQGPKYVPYYRERPGQDPQEDYVRCTDFMRNLADDYEAQHKLGEIIEVLPRDTVLQRRFYTTKLINGVPTAALETQEILTPEHPHYGGSKRAEYIQSIRARRGQLARQLRMEGGPSLPLREPADLTASGSGFTLDEDADSGVGTASAAPVRGEREARKR